MVIVVMKLLRRININNIPMTTKLLKTHMYGNMIYRKNSNE